MGCWTIAEPADGLWVYLEASDRGLRQLSIGPPLPDADAAARHDGHPVLREAVLQLQEYFEGWRRQFDVPLDLEGTPFQKRVWQVLRRIPYGETRTYAEVARLIGRPTAVRAVGRANGTNPVAIIVPCHRVLASSGGLGGYGAGLEVKRRLLMLEGAITSLLEPAGDPASRAALEPGAAVPPDR